MGKRAESPPIFVIRFGASSPQLYSPEFAPNYPSILQAVSMAELPDILKGE